MAPTTPNKRLFESAFTRNAPGMLVNAHSGLDAHLQALATAATPFTPSALPIPGRWPREEDLAADLDVAERIPEAAPSTIYTIGRWVLSATLGNVLALPARLIRRFARQQQIVVQPVFREDGAYKKRIIDAGPADEPTTPTRASGRATYMKKVGRGRARGRLVAAPSAVGFSSGSPVKTQTLPQPETPPSARDTSGIWQTGPTPVQVPAKQRPAVKDYLPWRSHVSLSAPETPDIWKPVPSPVPTPVQRVCDLVPSKAPGWPTPTPSPPKPAGSSFSLTTPPWITDMKTAVKEKLLNSDATEPGPAPLTEVAEDVSEVFDEDVGMDGMDDDNGEDDESDEWSFEGAFSSGTPPPPPGTDLSQYPRSEPVVLLESPVAESPVADSPVIASPSPNASHLSPAVQVSSRGPFQISPNTHMNIISNASVTPMRRQLLKKAALEQGVFNVVFSSGAYHTVPSPSIRVPEQTQLQQKSYQALNLKNNAAEVAIQAQQASERYRVAAEARRNYVPAMSAAEQEYYNYTETVDQELSFLDDAPDEEELPAPSPLPDRPVRRGGKAVRWNSHAHAKFFYYDEKVADMMDSTLEAIHSSPYRTLAKTNGSGNDSSEDEAAEPVISPSRNNNGSSTQQEPTAKQSVGFTGVPSSTWDVTDDSLEESQISFELLNNLQKELQEKLALAPPPPKDKAFMEPLSEEESAKLEAVAKKTQNGLIRDAHIVPEKLTAHDFSTLLPSMFSGDPKAWLNDNIVNEYLGVLIAHVKKEAGFVSKRGGPAPAVHAFSSFWYTTMKAKDYQGVARWAARFQLAGKQYLDADLLLYPICDGGHWRLLVVKPKERTIEYLDSLGWPGSKYTEKLKEYLKAELKEFWAEDEWTVLAKQRSTRQINGSDCGVFAILNALALLRGEEFVKVIACDGMSDARERIATTLMAGVPTTEFA